MLTSQCRLRGIDKIGTSLGRIAARVYGRRTGTGRSTTFSGREYGGTEPQFLVPVYEWPECSTDLFVSRDKE